MRVWQWEVWALTLSTFVCLSLSLSVAFHLFHLSTSWSSLSYSSARNAFQKKNNFNVLPFILALPPSLHLSSSISLSVRRTTWPIWERLKRCAAHFCAYDDYNWGSTGRTEIEGERGRVRESEREDVIIIFLLKSISCQGIRKIWPGSGKMKEMESDRKGKREINKIERERDKLVRSSHCHTRRPGEGHAHVVAHAVPCLHTQHSALSTRLIWSWWTKNDFAWTIPISLQRNILREQLKKKEAKSLPNSSNLYKFYSFPFSIFNAKLL